MLNNNNNINKIANSNFGVNRNTNKNKQRNRISRRNNRFLYRNNLNLNNLGVLYNYRQTPQRYGSGRLPINIETTVSMAPNTTFSYTPVHNTDEMLVACTQFMYVKLICYAVVQDNVNYTNESNLFQVYAYWGRNQEQVNDIIYNDNTKNLPNQGWANFQFKPPRSILNEEFAISSEGVQKRWFDPSQFNPVDQMYSVNEGWKFGLHFWFDNLTTQTRKVRVIGRFIFRGKRISDLSATKSLADSINKEKVEEKYNKIFINREKPSEETKGEIIDCKNLQELKIPKIESQNEEKNLRSIEEIDKEVNNEEKETEKQSEPLKLSNCNAYYLRKGKIVPLIFKEEQ